MRGFLISDLKHNGPDMNFGVTFLPSVMGGHVSAFVGGDVVAIPIGSKRVPLANAFVAWELTDEAQFEGLAKNNILLRGPRLPTTYFAADPRIVTSAKALGIGYVPWSIIWPTWSFGFESVDQNAAARDLRW